MLAPDIDFGTQTTSLQMVVNPLVNWVWLGFGVMAFGTGIALLPERTYSFALAKLPRGGDRRDDRAEHRVVDRAVGLGAIASCHAQAHVEDPNVASSPSRNALEEAAAARDRLHLRHLRARAAQQVHVRLRARDARRTCARRSTRERTATRSSSTSSVSTAARTCWWRRSTGASTAWPGSCPTARRRRRRLRRLRRHPLVPPAGWNGGGSRAPVDPDIEERLDDELRNLD